MNDVPCANFEANIFARSLCQHCFRAARVHPHAAQVSSSIPPAGHECCIKSCFVRPWDFVEMEIPSTKACGVHRLTVLGAELEPHWQGGSGHS